MTRLFERRNVASEHPALSVGVTCQGRLLPSPLVIVETNDRGGLTKLDAPARFSGSHGIERHSERIVFARLSRTLIDAVRTSANTARLNRIDDRESHDRTNVRQLRARNDHVVEVVICRVGQHLYTRRREQVGNAFMIVKLL